MLCGATPHGLLFSAMASGMPMMPTVYAGQQVTAQRPPGCKPSRKLSRKALFLKQAVA